MTDIERIRRVAGPAIAQANKIDTGISVLVNSKLKVFWSAVNELWPANINATAESMLEDLYEQEEDRDMEAILAKASVIMERWAKA